MATFVAYASRVPRRALCNLFEHYSVADMAHILPAHTKFSCLLFDEAQVSSMGAVVDWPDDKRGFFPLLEFAILTCASARPPTHYNFPGTDTITFQAQTLSHTIKVMYAGIW